MCMYVWGDTEYQKTIAFNLSPSTPTLTLLLLSNSKIRKKERIFFLFSPSTLS